MLKRWLGLVALVGLAGCSGSPGAPSVSNPDTPLQGGQTGSLLPCQPTPLARAGSSIPSSDRAIVLNCASATDNVVIRDENGQAVTFELEPLGDGNFLVRTDSALAAGTYSVGSTSNTQSTDVEVTEAKPLPMKVGEVQQTEQLCQTNSFELTWTEQAQEYAPVMAFRVQVDDDTGFLLRDFGETSIDSNGTSTFFLSNCRGECLQPGTHTLTLQALIAGESALAQPDLLQIDFNVIQCPDQAGFFLCATHAPEPKPRTPLSWLGLAAAALLVRRRRLRS